MFKSLSLSQNIVVVQSLSCVRLSVTPRTAACQAGPCPSLSPRACSNSCPLSRWCHQPSHPLSLLLLLPSIFPSIRVFSSESAFHIRWPKYWSFSFSISPVSEYSGLSWISLQSKGLSRVFCSITVQKHLTSRFFLSAKGPGRFLWASVSLTIKI